MSCDQIEEIIRITNQNPSAFTMTLSCLERRAKILKDVEANCNDHDSLVSQYKTNYIRTLENCDLMLERVFEKETHKTTTQVNYIAPTLSRANVYNRIADEMQWTVPVPGISKAFIEKQSAECSCTVRKQATENKR